MLPPYSLLVEAATFPAFVACSWGGHAYEAPVLFTLTSLDDQALPVSSRVRVFHGFGEGDIAWGDRILRVDREEII